MLSRRRDASRTFSDLFECQSMCNCCFVLCIDESFDGCNRTGIGERLFDAEGEQSQYLNGMLKFLREYQAHFARTQIFCKKLLELDLLESVGAQFTPPKGERRPLTAFLAINRQNMQALTGEQYEELAKTGELELAYIHLQSLRNFTSIMERAKQKGIDEEDISSEKIVEDSNSDKEFAEDL